jgi:alanine racemase
MLRGRRRPVAGLVSMDQVVVDVGDETIEVGDVATVFGPGEHGEPTVIEWAAWAGTIEHEIVTGIGSRVVRQVLPAGEATPASLVLAGAGAAAAR